MLLRIVLEIPPVPKQTARTSFLDQRGRMRERPVTFTPEETAAFQQQVWALASSHLAKAGIRRPAIPAPEPVFLAPIFYLDPQNAPKKYRELPYPTCKPDTSNLLKALEDGLTGVLWSDDSQVTLAMPMKLWAQEQTKPRIELWVADLEEMGELFPSLAESVPPPIGARLRGGCAWSRGSRSSTPTMLKHAGLGVGMLLATSALLHAVITTSATLAT